MEAKSTGSWDLLSERHASQFLFQASVFGGIVRSSQAIGKLKKLSFFRLFSLQPRFDKLNQNSVRTGALTLG